jgi:hypothetical protein
MKTTIHSKCLIKKKMSTLEMEEAHTRCGCEFGLEIMFYEDGEKEFPHKVIGYVQCPEKGWIISTWNKYGECTLRGAREIDFDLIRNGTIQKKIDSMNFVMVGLIGIFITVIYLILLK